jgi:predicted transcriptional regulator
MFETIDVYRPIKTFLFFCQQFNKVKWCVENERGKEEIRIVTGMKTHLIEEYLKIMEEHNVIFPP